MAAPNQGGVSFDCSFYYDEFHKLYVDMCTESPEQRENAQLLKLFEYSAKLVEFAEKQCDTVGELQEQNSQLKTQVEDLHQQVYKSRQDRDEYVEEIEKNWADDVQRYVRELDEVKAEKNFLKTHVDEMENDLELLRAEKGKAEEMLKGFRDRWDNRKSRLLCSPADSSELETAESDLDGYEADESQCQYSSPGGKSMFQHLISEIQRRDEELNELRSRSEGADTEHYSVGLLNELEMLREENDHLRCLLANRDPSLSPPRGSSDRTLKRNSLLYELNLADSTPNHSFVERTRTRAGLDNSGEEIGNSLRFSDAANQTVETESVTYEQRRFVDHAAVDPETKWPNTGCHKKNGFLDIVFKFIVVIVFIVDLLSYCIRGKHLLFDYTPAIKGVVF